ncbi:MAG TPA: hypothetical protein V6C64_09160 [Microcoleaceae cyanobacterium]
MHHQALQLYLWSTRGLLTGAIALFPLLPTYSQPISQSASDLFIGQTPSPPSSLPPSSSPSTPASIDLDPELINTSPVLQRWLRQVPNVMADIKHDRSFRTRLRLGYSQFPSTDDASGWYVGIEDVFIDRTGLTVSADYQASFNGKRESWGTDLRYYVLPLGGYVNLAPVVGYRYIETSRYSTDGVNIGARLLLVPSRTGAADISLTQSWVSPGSDNEVGMTTLSVGYALTHHLRLSTDFQKQNSRYRQDSRLGIGVEWMF